MNIYNQVIVACICERTIAEIYDRASQVSLQCFMLSQIEDQQVRVPYPRLGSVNASTRASTNHEVSANDTNMSLYEKKLEIVIDQFLESYVPQHSVYVILYFGNRSAIAQTFRDRARMLVSKMGSRTRQKVKFELFYGEKDLWFELGHVMNSMQSSKYVFSYNSTK